MFVRVAAVLPSGNFEQKKERHRCETMDSFLKNELLRLQEHERTRVVLSHHHQRRPLSLLALNISKIC